MEDRLNWIENTAINEWVVIFVGYIAYIFAMKDFNFEGVCDRHDTCYNGTQWAKSILRSEKDLVN